MPTNQVISYNLLKGARTLGKTFYVSGTSGALWLALNLTYTPDSDGVPRVYTSYTDAIAACTSGQGDVIISAPDFTTNPTATEIANASTKGVTILPAGTMSGDLQAVNRASATIPSTTSSAIFNITGKVRIVNIVGTVTTAIGATTTDARLDCVDGDGTLTSLALCAAGGITNMPVGTQMGITGTFANDLVTPGTSGAGQMAMINQATPVVISKNAVIRFKTLGTTTGAVRWHCQYIPMEPGAKVTAA